MRRNEGLQHDAELGYPLKKSKSFRARASQAFKSIRNLNKASRNSKAAAEGSENMNLGAITEDGMHSTRSSTPNLGRRKSVQLAQLFTPSRSTRFSTSDVPPSPTLSEWSAVSRPSLALGDRTNSPSPAPSFQSEQPTLSTKRSFRRRISVLNLKRVFNSSTESADHVSAPSSSQSGGSISAPISTLTNGLRRDSSPLPRSSSSSSSMLRSFGDVLSSFPSGDSHPHSYQLGSAQTSFALAESTSYSFRTPIDDDVDMDENLELRLDSLHFDSLHFDLDEFDLDDL